MEHHLLLIREKSHTPLQTEAMAMHKIPAPSWYHKIKFKYICNYKQTIKNKNTKIATPKEQWN